jgi:hypothetical protein
MYTIVGADGREYGPATADQLRQWLAEGRANAQTKVRVEGSTDWKLLSQLEEFFPKPAPAPVPAPLAAPAPFSVTPVPRTNPLAVTGMVLGILSIAFACCCYGLPFNIAGILFSSVALSQIKNDPLNQQGKGMATAGLVLSIVSIVLAGLVLALGLASRWTHLLHRMRF